MNPKRILCLALVLNGLLTDCVIHREFRGSTANLKGDGTSVTNYLNIDIAGSGNRHCVLLKYLQRFLQ
jgi:hypothetical protein